MTRPTITRRGFLIGAGATGAVTVAGGGVVAATHPHSVRRFLHGAWSSTSSCPS